MVSVSCRILTIVVHEWLSYKHLSRWAAFEKQTDSFCRCSHSSPTPQLANNITHTTLFTCETEFIHPINIISKHANTETVVFVCFWLGDLKWARASSFVRFLDHNQRLTTFGRTPLDEWSARRRDLYLTTHTTDRHSCLRWDSNSQPQRTSGRRSTS